MQNSIESNTQLFIYLYLSNSFILNNYTDAIYIRITSKMRLKMLNLKVEMRKRQELVKALPPLAVDTQVDHSHIE